MQKYYNEASIQTFYWSNTPSLQYFWYDATAGPSLRSLRFWSGTVSGEMISGHMFVLIEANT